jgi:hypothetical protein
MAKTPPITNVTSGFSSTTALNNNFEALKDGFDNTLSLDGSTPNAMQAELDLSNNSIINAGSVETDKLLLNGTLVTPSGVDPVLSGTVSTFGASLIDDADAATARTTLGLGTAATSSTTDFVGTSGSGTIAGDLDITGDLEVTSDGLPSTVLDRLNSDGTILELKKDGTTVGSISTKVDAVDGVGDMYLGTGDTGLFFHDRNNQILPVDTATGLTRNSIVHLGSTGAKFAQVHSATFHGDGSNLTGISSSTAYGAVGTYGLFFYQTLGQNAPATTVSGSSLYPANTYDYSGHRPTYSGSGHPSGTWRLMGQTGYYNETVTITRNDFNTSVFVRIS